MLLSLLFYFSLRIEALGFFFDIAIRKSVSGLCSMWVFSFSGIFRSSWCMPMHSFHCDVILRVMLKELVLAECQEKLRIFSPGILSIRCMHLHMPSYSLIRSFHSYTNIHTYVLHALQAFLFYLACTSNFFISMHVLPFFRAYRCAFLYSLRTRVACTPGRCFLWGERVFCACTSIWLCMLLWRLFFRREGETVFLPSWEHASVLVTPTKLRLQSTAESLAGPLPPG